MPFAFLSELQRAFTAAFDPSDLFTADPSHFTAFGMQIQLLMERYNTSPPQDEIARAQGELSQVRCSSVLRNFF